MQQLFCIDISSLCILSCMPNDVCYWAVYSSLFTYALWPELPNFVLNNVYFCKNVLQIHKTIAQILVFTISNHKKGLNCHIKSYFTITQNKRGAVIFCQNVAIMVTVLWRIVLFLELHQSIFGWASEKWGQWLALPMQCQVIVKGPREGQFLPFAKNVRRGLLAAATT